MKNAACNPAPAGYNENMETNLSRVRNSIKPKKPSQATIAKAARMSVRTLQGYEAGQREINKAAAIVVLRLADALGCEVRDILEPEPEAKEDAGE